MTTSNRSITSASGMPGTGSRDNCMRIGDLVTLKVQKNQSYLSGEGILVEDLYVSKSMKCFEEHVFQIYIQRQYSATNELDEFMGRLRISGPAGSSGLDQAAKNHMEALVKGKENESVLNSSVMKNKTGNQVLFGDTIQLLHVKSGKFVTVLPSDLARDERENMRVYLSPDGSVLSWVKITPRYKINREGEPLTNNTEVLLKFIERSNEYLHCSERNPPRGKQFEVNSSLDAPTAWKMGIFQTARDLSNPALLLCGQLVYVKDPELQSVLAPLPKELRKLDMKNTCGGGRGDDEFSVDDSSVTSADDFVRDYGQVVLKPCPDALDLDSDAIWTAEWKGITRGGPINFESDRVHLRHFNTGKYLSISWRDPSVPDMAIYSQKEAVFSLKDAPSEVDTLFQINQLHSSEQQLMNSRASQLKHDSGVYLARGEYFDAQKVFACQAIKNRGKAVSIIVNRYEQRDKSTRLPQQRVLRKCEEVYDIHFGNAVMQHITKFLRAIIIPSSVTHDAVTIWPKMDIVDRSFFTTIVSKASLFARGYPLSVLDLSPSELSKVKTEKAVIVRRQHMLRQQGLVELLIDMLRLLIPISDWLVADSSQVGTNKLTRVGGFMEVGKRVLNDCLNLLFDLIKNNLQNQFYIADHLLVVLAHISTDKMAAKVAQELLSSNRELQDNNIGPQEITAFAEKMREVPMSSMYLQLLQTCCSCLGQGIPKNQDAIYSIVFNSYKDVLISLFAVPLKASAADLVSHWHSESHTYALYIAPYVGRKCIRAEALLVKHLLALRVGWSSSTQNKQQPNRYSSQRLFNKDSVPLQELYRAYRDTYSSSGGHAKKEREMKRDSERAVCDFLTSQINLAAEMCVGRNYHVITALEQTYTYDVLVTILRTPSSDMLQRAAAYLLEVLYVDREPQSMVQVPRLTRTMTQVTKSGSLDMVRVDGNDNFQFALVQYLIASHLSDIKDKRFPNHSHQLLKVLNKLVVFNFYGDVDKLKDLVGLLVASLRRGDFDISTSPVKASPHSKRASIMLAGTTELSDSNLETTGLLIAASLLESGKSSEAESSSVADRSSALEAYESPPVQMAFMFFVLSASGATLYFYFWLASFSLFDAFELCVLGVLVVLHASHLALFVSHRKAVLPFFSQHVNNCIGLATLLLYLTYFVPGVGTHIYHFAKFCELLKLPVLVKASLMDSSREAAATSSSGNDADVAWKEPDRYILTSESTIATMVQIVQTLCAIQRNVEDLSLSRLLKAYLKWMKEDKATPALAYELFVDVTESNAVNVSNDEYDAIYIDLLMYGSPELTQATLELLMNHHSSNTVLLNNAEKMQLIVSTSDEDQYFKLERVMSILKRDADCHELWGKLLTAEHRKTNADMSKYLQDLRDICRKPRDVLRFDDPFEPVKACQNILRNLGCFELCIQIAKLIETIDKSDFHLPHHQNTRHLALLANQLLYWFVLDNPSNQTLAYSQLRFMIKTVDAKIDSHKVLSAIFRDNLPLMESAPKKHIPDFVKMICSNGRQPQYLSLMSSIITVGEKNVIENQYEIIKLVSSPENVKKVCLYFVPTSHPDYAKKIEAMRPYLHRKDIDVDSLPPDLAYHLELMGLLSRCTVGRSRMTTIEAKVQSMFNFVDIINAMLDVNCLLLGRIRLGTYLYNAVLDVETLLPALKDANCIWQLIISTQDVFAFAKDELRQIEKNGWSSPHSNRQEIEYMIVCAMIVHAYFVFYYDRSVFKADMGGQGQVAAGVDRVVLKESQANDIIKSIYLKVQAIYEMLSPLLPLEHHELLFDTLKALNSAAKEQIVATVDNLHESFFKMADEYAANDGPAGAGPSKGRSYDDFLQALKSNPQLSGYAEGQMQSFIAKFEQLPLKSSSSLEKTNANVRFEALIEKLVSHIYGGVQVITLGEETMKFIDANATRTDVWILRMFRTMIENLWGGMDIFDRDENGGEEQDDAVVGLMQIYGVSGVPRMCLELIAKGVDMSLQSEAIKLLIAMLLKSGGALEIQQLICRDLSVPGSEQFFLNVRNILNSLMSWHKWNGVISLKEGQDPELPPELILVRCLQLFCEGHYLPNQDLLREQPNNLVSVNLLDVLVLYIQTLDTVRCRTSTEAAMAVYAVILEIIQGPCEGNQDYFALNTELIETLNKKIRQRPVNDCDELAEAALKTVAIDILQALLEGQGHKTAVYERMLSVIHIDVIHVLSKEPMDHIETEAGGGGGGELVEAEEVVKLRTEALVLLQMLTDFRPSLKRELGISDDPVREAVSDTVACIEVVWHGELQRRFFFVPEICRKLAKSTKDNFVMYVNRSSAEDKLYGLLSASKDMYREILHQQLLTDLKIDKIFSRTNEERATWIAFYFVCCLNLFFTIFYTLEEGSCELNQFTDGMIRHKGVCTIVTLHYDIVKTTVVVLNSLLVACSLFVLLLYVVVRMPVNYQTYYESLGGVLQATLYTAMDPVAVYNVCYLLIAIAGLRYHLLLPFLLLDFISKSPTSQAVLRAVYNPRMQVIMTFILMMILTYIFAFFQFFFFNDANNYTGIIHYSTLWHSFKFLVRLGLPYGSPQNYVNFTIETYRVINDIMFFVVTMLILNILKGITIDTFVGLRKELEERLDDTSEKCFICGIDKNTFNRTLDRDAFAVHTKVDQNLWNYIYFIIYIWEQDRDDDDGLEWFVRRCIETDDLVWFPMRKAMRLTEHQEKGDVNSLKYKFRKDLSLLEEALQGKLSAFKDQLARTVGRVEKSLDFDGLEVVPSSAAKASRGSTAFHPSADMGDISATPYDDADDPDDVNSTLESSTISTMKSSQLWGLQAEGGGVDVHVKVVSIVGLHVTQDHLSSLYVRFITPHGHTAAHPLSELTIVSSYEEVHRQAYRGGMGMVDQESSLSIDTIFGDALHPSQQQHQSLIKFDGPCSCVVGYNYESSQIEGGSRQQAADPMVKVQVLFGTGERPFFVGGIAMSVSELFRQGQGQQYGGLIEAPFYQRYVEAIDGRPGADLTTSSSSQRRCFITLSIAVSTR